MASSDSARQGAHDPFAPGRRLGDWEVLEVLGRGGQGVVLRARRPPEGPVMALKLVFRGDDPARLLRFQQEGRLLQRLSHENLLQVAEVGEAGGHPCIAMELVEGEDLTSLASRGPPPFAWSAGVMGRVALALHHCHGQGVVHRDLKPANVIVERGTGRPVVVDFGLAKRDASKLAMATIDEGLRSLPGELKGTPAYMAPEQADQGVTSPASDVYALGATLFFLLTGAPPVSGATPMNVIARLLSQGPTDPRALNPAVPAPLAELCLQAMAHDPGERPRSAAAFAAALRRALPAASTPPPAGSRRALALGATLVCLGLLGTLLLVLLRRPSLPAPPPAPPPAPAPAPPPAPAPVEEALKSARVLEKASRWQDAIEAFGRVLELDPARAEAWHRRARCRFRLGDLQGCIADAERAIALDPGAWGAFHYRGAALHSLSRDAEALPDFDRALELRPREPISHRYRAMARIAVGDLPGAEADLTRALELKDNEPHSSLRLRAEVRERLGDLPGAIQDCEALQALRPSPELEQRLARLRAR